MGLSCRLMGRRVSTASAFAPAPFGGGSSCRAALAPQTACQRVDARTCAPPGSAIFLRADNVLDGSLLLITNEFRTVAKAEGFRVPIGVLNPDR